MLMGNGKQARTCGPDLQFLVELPGIEPGAEIMLTCRNAEFDDAKVRETTRNDAKRRETTWEYAKGVDGVNTHTGRQYRPMTFANHTPRRTRLHRHTRRSTARRTVSGGSV
jgi:hypothetical protein